jgi:hypothetical protein
MVQVSQLFSKSQSVTEEAVEAFEGAKQVADRYESDDQKTGRSIRELGAMFAEVVSFSDSENRIEKEREEEEVAAEALEEANSEEMGVEEAIAEAIEGDAQADTGQDQNDNSDDANEQALASDYDGDSDPESDDSDAAGKRRRSSLAEANSELAEAVELAEVALKQLGSLGMPMNASFKQMVGEDDFDIAPNLLMVEQDTDEKDGRAFLIYADDDEELDTPWSVSWNSTVLKIEIPVNDSEMISHMAENLGEIESRLGEISGVKVAVSFRLIGAIAA